MKHTTSDKAQVVKDIEKNSGLDLRNYHEWLRIKAELEAVGFKMTPAIKPESRKPRRRQPVPLSALGI